MSSPLATKLSTLMAPIGIELDPDQLDDSIDHQPLNSILPGVGLGLSIWDAITKSDSASNPLFRFNFDDLSPIDDAVAEAARAKAAGDENLFQAWSQQALNEARKMPNGEALAVPMAEADLLAIEGKFLEASKKYQMVEATLEATPSCSRDLQATLDAVKARHRGVLGAGVASSALNFAKAQKENDVAGMLESQRVGTACADELYLSDPSEKGLRMLVASYAQLGLDLRSLRTNIKQNEAKIQEIMDGMTGFKSGFIIKPLKTTPDDPLGGKIPTPSFPSTNEPTIDELKALNASGQDVINRTEAHFLELIAKTHSDDPFHEHIDAATALAIGGNNKEALSELQEARDLFRFGSVHAPHTPENTATAITILHRMVGISGIDYDLHDEVLKEARDLILDMKKSDPDQAILLTIENMELQGSVNADRGEHALAHVGGDDDEQETAAYNHQQKIRKGQMDIVDFCEKSLKDVKDPLVRQQIGARMFEARAAVLELDLGEALVAYDKDDKDKAQRCSNKWIGDFNDFAAKHKDIPSPEGYAESMGRARLAQAYYEFRTGNIEGSIFTLKGIQGAYGDSSAARSLSKTGYWTRESGIVDENGHIADTDKADVLAAIKTAASKLNKEKGRGLAACGVGAALFVGADLLAGEKVSGVAVATGCTAAFLVDRAMLVAQSSNEIAAAYRTGISNVTTGEALLSVGEFALDVASMYVGGGAGALAEKGVLAIGSRYGGELTGFLLSRGLKPGPWTRALGEFALKETAYATNAVAFQKTSSFVHQTGSALLHGQAPSYKDTDTSEDYLVSWLFVRVMPMAMEADVGGRIIKGESHFDRAVQKGVNMGYAATIIQDIRALATDDPSQMSGDKVGGAMWDLFFMHHGNRALESVVAPKFLRTWSQALDQSTLNNLTSLRKAIDEAPSSGSWWDASFGWIKTGGTPPEPLNTETPSDDPSTDPAPALAKQAKPAQVIVIDPQPTGDDAVTRPDMGKSNNGSVQISPTAERDLMRTLTIFEVKSNVEANKGGTRKINTWVNGEGTLASDIDIKVANDQVRDDVIQTLRDKNVLSDSDKLDADGNINVRIGPSRIIPLKFSSFGDTKRTSGGGGNANYSVALPAYGVFDFLTGHGVHPALAVAGGIVTAIATAGVFGTVFGRSGRVSEDPRLSGEEGSGATGGSYKVKLGTDNPEGRFVLKTIRDGQTVAFTIETKGPATTGFLMADAIKEGLRQGKPLDQVLADAKREVEEPFMEDGQVIPGGPEIKGVAAFLNELSDGTYQVRVLGEGDLDTVAIRGGYSSPTVFEATGSASPSDPLKTGDIVVSGAVKRAFGSMGALRDVVVSPSHGTSPGEVLDAVMQEARIRAVLAENFAGQTITDTNYAFAYEKATGKKPSKEWKGYYASQPNGMGGYKTYRLDASGNVIDPTNTVVDKFSAENINLTVQVVGQR